MNRHVRIAGWAFLALLASLGPAATVGYAMHAFVLLAFDPVALWKFGAVYSLFPFAAFFVLPTGLLLGLDASDREGPWSSVRLRDVAVPFIASYALYTFYLWNSIFGTFRSPDEFAIFAVTPALVLGGVGYRLSYRIVTGGSA